MLGSGFHERFRDSHMLRRVFERVVDACIAAGLVGRGANMLNVHARPSSPPSPGILLATLLAAVGLGATIGFSMAQPTQAEAPMNIDRPVSVQLAQATPSTTTSVNEKDAIHKVLSGYYDAFGRDSAAASAFYGEPTLIVLPNEIVMLNTRADVAAFFDKFVANLRSSGYSHSKFGDYSVKLLNSTTALFSTVATRIKTDGTEMQRSGFTYLLHKSNAGWRIHEIIATDLDKLISAD
jgi:hypothetical protein